ncbi:hypothetical protein HDU76_007069 [Blyttiomyces sp. JEL0837]|nr:hypothetical protein HDU76_007069 [Blyttiomyces sp. JEL0837]
MLELDLEQQTTLMLEQLNAARQGAAGGAGQPIVLPLMLAALPMGLPAGAFPGLRIQVPADALNQLLAAQNQQNLQQQQQPNVPAAQGGVLQNVAPGVNQQVPGGGQPAQIAGVQPTPAVATRPPSAPQQGAQPPTQNVTRMQVQLNMLQAIAQAGRDAGNAQQNQNGQVQMQQIPQQGLAPILIQQLQQPQQQPQPQQPQQPQHQQQQQQIPPGPPQQQPQMVRFRPAAQPAPAMFPTAPGLGLPNSLRLKRPLRVSLLLQAVELNHLRLAEILVSPRSTPTHHRSRVAAELRRMRGYKGAIWKEVEKLSRRNNSASTQMNGSGNAVNGGSNNDRLAVTTNSPLTAEPTAMSPSESEPDSGDMVVSRISFRTLREALREAFGREKIEMCRILIERGGATPNSDIVQDLLAKAGMMRFTRFRSRIRNLLCLAVAHLPEEEFRRMQGTLVRSCSEIGILQVMKVVIARQADVNVFDGHALYASIYNGNLAMTRFLLADRVETIHDIAEAKKRLDGFPSNRGYVTVKGGGANVRTFSWKQKLFCAGLVFMEGFAILMFVMLFVIWVLGLVQLIFGIPFFASFDPTQSSRSSNNDNIVNTNTTSGNQTIIAVPTLSTSPDTLTISELTGMLVPSAIALVVMYRLVPFHRLVHAYVLAMSVSGKARRALRARQRAAQAV